MDLLAAVLDTEQRRELDEVFGVTEATYFIEEQYYTTCPRIRNCTGYKNE
jgi:hypothetical protein